MDVHANVHTSVHSWEFLEISWSVTTRAVKGGAAEASDVSAPSLEGPALSR